MAELTQEQIDDFIKLANELAKKNPEIARGLRDVSSSLRTHRRSIDLAINDQQRQLRHLRDYTNQMRILSGPGEGGVARFIKGMKDGRSVIDEYKRTLESLDETIDNTADSAKKLELEIEREAMARRISSLAIKQASVDFVKSVGKQLGTTVVQTTGTFVRGLQDNASATKLSTDILSGAVDLAAGATKAAGQGMSQVGGTLASMGKSPYVKAAGLGLMALGFATDKASDSASKLAKFGIEVLSKEVEKTVTAFNNISRSGAMFADGMTGMRMAAFQAGLTTEQFSKVVVENSGLLAASGLGVGEASRRMGAVTVQFDTTFNSSGKSLRRQMLQLGYSFEEQAGLVAETMADMRIGRSSMMKDDRAIAEQTASYASNLRTISALTGEDAKRKMDEQRAASTQVAFRLKLQELEQKQPGITQKVLQSMTTMDATSRKALMEQLTLGTVVDKSANIMMSGSEAYGEKISGMSKLIESGSFSVEEAQRIQAEANDKMQGDLANFREIGMANMTGALGELNTAISGQISNMDKITADAVISSQTLVDQQKNTNDKLTEGVMKAAEAAQSLKKSLEEVLTPAIAKYAEITGTILKTLEDQLKELGLVKKTGTEKEPSFFQKYGRNILDYGGTALGGLAGGLIGGGTTGGVGTAVGVMGGAQIGSTIGSAIADYLGLPPNPKGKALGGIAEGPEGGYLEKLHGIEAVVPLSNNRSIPVQINADSIGKKTGSPLESMNSMMKTVFTGIRTGQQQIGQSMSRGTVLQDISSAGTDILGSLKQSLGDAKSFVESRAAPVASAVGEMLFPNLGNKGLESTKIIADRVGGTGSSAEMEMMMKSQLTLLNDIKDILATSNNLQQQYVYNTYK